jgi:hypothetical protein
MSDVAIGRRDEADVVAKTPVERGEASGLVFRVVRVGTDDQQSQWFAHVEFSGRDASLMIVRFTVNSS